MTTEQTLSCDIVLKDFGERAVDLGMEPQHVTEVILRLQPFMEGGDAQQLLFHYKSSRGALEYLCCVYEAKARKSQNVLDDYASVLFPKMKNKSKSIEYTIKETEKRVHSDKRWQVLRDEWERADSLSKILRAFMASFSEKIMEQYSNNYRIEIRADQNATY